MNIATMKLAVEAYVAANIPVMLWGPPGSAKSQGTKQVADHIAGGRMLTYRLNLLESVDLRGLPHIEDSEVVWAVPDMIADLERLAVGLRSGEIVILFLDEINTASQSVMSAAMQLVLDRRIGPHRLPDCVRIIGAGNRQKDRASANRTGTALNNRFAHLEVEPDKAEWIDYAKGQNWNPLVIAFIGFRPNLLHVMPQDDSPAFPSPRSWEMAQRIAHATGTMRAVLVRGVVGSAAAAELEAFVGAWSRVPKLADIIADPDHCPVPDASEPALQYAVAVQVASGAKRENFAPLMRYIERLPRDHQVVCIIEATKRDKGLMQTVEFTGWVAANADVQT